MGAALAAQSTDDERVRALITEAYAGSYATISQVAMIGEENRLSDKAAHDIRAFRTAHTVPDVPLRILTATRGKPPSMQRHYEELAARTASAFRRGSHEVVAESGHYIHHDQPQAVLKAVGDIGVR